MDHPALLEFVNGPGFHQVKHTESFRVLVDRLIYSEEKLNTIAKMADRVTTLSESISGFARMQTVEWKVDPAAWDMSGDSTPRDHEDTESEGSGI